MSWGIPNFGIGSFIGSKVFGAVLGQDFGQAYLINQMTGQGGFFKTLVSDGLRSMFLGSRTNSALMGSMGMGGMGMGMGMGMGGLGMGGLGMGMGGLGMGMGGLGMGGVGMGMGMGRFGFPLGGSIYGGPMALNPYMMNPMSMGMMPYAPMAFGRGFWPPF